MLSKVPPAAYASLYTFACTPSYFFVPSWVGWVIERGKQITHRSSGAAVFPFCSKRITPLVKNRSGGARSF
jgi:hypothetical protein